MGKHDEQLTAAERAAIMTMKASNRSARQIALALYRAPSTIARELSRVDAWLFKESQMSKVRPSCPAEFRQQMVELVRAGRYR